MARTTTTNFLVLIAEQIEPEPLAWLSERCDVVRADQGSPTFQETLAKCEALVVRTYTQVDESLLAQAPALRVVARAGVGLDNVDLEACAKRGVRVVHTPDANTQSVVEYVMCVVLDYARPRPAASAGLSLEAWKADRERAQVSHDLADLTLGIWGLGRIGSRVARAATALGLRVIYHDLREVEEPDRWGASPVSREELLEASDILTIHVDGRAENRGMLAAGELAHAKPGVLIVNTSRGFVIDPASLAAFLRSHGTARAVLDVHDPEPIPEDSPLVGLVNAVLTPHIAAGTRSAKLAMSWVVKDVVEALKA